jgi:phenazine biosynthesis protein phzE
VRDSDPGAEADETRAKAATLIAAIRGDAPLWGAGAVLPSDPRVRRALRARTARLSRFWQDPVRSLAPALAGTRVLVVDAEDAFTAMLAHQVRALGSAVTVRRFDAARVDGAGVDGADRFDAVVVGPGPGDPRDLTDPKIAALRELTRRLLAGRVPMLSICLGHQVLAGLLGLPLRRNATPTQGIQREIEFLGRPERVGFYNTFSAYASADRLDGSIDVSRDAATGEVFGLHGPRMCSVQFHPESVLTENGAAILRDLLGRVIQLGC